MKQFIIALAAIASLTSCSDDDKSKTNEINAPVIGEWHLIEVLADPGDGSGTFNPVESSKTVTFKSNGEVTSNMGICFSTDGTPSTTPATFNPDDQTITTDCKVGSYPVSYEITNSQLILHYISIEGYSEKYDKRTVN